ncbi:hypothetical protein H0W91_02800 [Patescibacteria group bacterium]|nr:hypothetical protein [Patescibacteria group bacterium]
MEFHFDAINIIILVVTVLNLSLGIIVFLTKRQSRVNQSFFVFLIAATGWCISMFLFRSLANTNIALLLARVLYMSAALIPLSLIYFIEVFPKEEKNLPYILNLLMPVPLLVVLAISFFPLLIIGVNYISGKEPVILFNPSYHTAYAIYIVSYFTICYVLLFVKYLHFQNDEKKQILYIFAGTLIATLIGVSTNLTMPYFGDFRLNWMGQVGIIAMIGAISYSIIKHRLFNLKIVATQFIVFVLCVSLFIRLLLSSNRSDLLINLIFLLIMMIIGWFLVKSVIEEVNQREKAVHLAEDLDKSNSMLKEANQGQASLMHFMNHQIKGRFGNTKNIFAELLSGDYGTMPSDTLPLLAKGLDEANIGVNYVQGILKGASAESGTLPYEMKQMDFRKLVESVVLGQKEYAEKKGLAYISEILPGDYSINGDALQLSEAVRNLIDNSVNYTEKGSIKMNLSVNKDWIELIVKDTGIGISDQDKLRLFTSGGRGVDSLKVNVNATGFGLVFVKGVVEAHKGKVWAESEGVGKGSTFYINLPVQS